MVLTCCDTSVEEMEASFICRLVAPAAPAISVLTRERSRDASARLSELPLTAADRALDAGERGVERARHLADLVAAGGVDALGQVALRERGQHGPDALDGRMTDRRPCIGDQDEDQHRHGQDDADDPARPGDRARHVGALGA